MRDRTSNGMYYVEGSTVRKVVAEPDIRRTPDRREERRTDTRTEERRQRQRQLSKKTDRALAFDFKYTVFVVASVMIMVFACVTMLYMESKISTQKNNINSMEAELEALQNDNAAYRMSLDNMYSLNDIYDVATNELGMVYAKKGQIVYYNSANEDYVKQYQDVPEAN